MSKPKLLIVEDDEGLCSQYRWAFPGCDLVITHARPQALAAAQKERPSVAIIDLGLPPDPDGVTEGFATLEALVRQVPNMKVIVATSHGDRMHALRAIGSGAYDFCEKPMDIDLLRTIIDRAVRLHELEDENRRLAEAPAPSPIKRIITASDAMLKVCRTIERLATTNVSVLLLGESGTGKEALARAVHELGPRAKQPFIAINCGAIPENLLESELFGYERGAFTGAVKQTIGKIEAANKGTLFLDEIGDLPHQLQVKLLRFLQEQVIERIGGRQTIPVDVRIVSATNMMLEEQVGEGRFRNDLFYRLNSVTVRIPPLRDRPGDAMLLARYFLSRFNREFGRNIRGFTEEAISAISGHAWPGNVRELENRMKRAVVMADARLIDAADLELAPGATDPHGLDLRAARLRAEREVLQKALARSNGTLATAAKLLGISRPTLYTLMEAHGVAHAPGDASDAAAGQAVSHSTNTG
ncbi:PEP-CTERM-box response regulator transcription factor [Limobrevibacterium gyesilva]|uniref:PEP-CTERM-box response regulator transcription factor n=1 Tax=Limobrevibacterium gyesilva TaxID=2991712 RepID=A0AA41YQB6_9PROT|nr:PEP-CTERM-box response regulator transcription factor [Limobrevibacterium gyesilva]MCW3476910.1 PEP-CTERM-box response regulator transcription factor [Limobrevibacterium gyesilva]